MRSFEPFWITSKDGNKLVKPDLEKRHVIANNGLMIEISDNEYEKCVEIEDIKVCNDFPEVYHSPGQKDCISNVVLNRTSEQIHESCNWIIDTKSE